MQKIQNFFILALFLSTAFLTSCNHDSNNNNNPGTTPSAGIWKVTYLFDKLDKTSNYDGYVFDFGANGSLTATHLDQSWNGTWSTGVDDSKNKLVIAFSGTLPSAMEDLQEDWLIIKMDDSVMEFEHISGGNGGTGVLHFEHL